MKKRFGIIFISVYIMFCFIACNQTADEASIEEAASEETTLVEPLILSKSYEYNVASIGESVQLVCRAKSSQNESYISYQWYEGEPENGTLIENEVYSTYTTPVITATGINNYYCLVTENLFDNGDGTKKTESTIIPFCVACTGLPVLYISTGTVPTSSINKDSYCTGNFRLVTDDYGITEYRFTKVKNGVVKEGIKGRGNTSWGMPKKGYNIKFDKKQSFFGLSESKKWCIIANYSDKTLLRNKFASILGTDIFKAGWNPTFVNVDVVLNGEYLGNYTFCEKNTIGSGRIDVQDIADVDEKLAANKANKVTDANSDGVKNLEDGGFILEIDARHDADFWFDTALGVPITLKDPDEVSNDVKNRIQSVVQTAEDVLYGNNFEDSTEGWRKYIDEEAAIDWYLVNEFTKNNDARFFCSVYIYYNPADGKLYLGPNWDFDISCGNINYNGNDNPENTWIQNSNWISRMFDDATFTEKIKIRWNEKKSKLYTAINSEIQSLADENAISAEFNFRKWPILGTYVWPNAADYENRTTYQSEVQYLIDWCNIRYNWLDTEINSY